MDDYKILPIFLVVSILLVPIAIAPPVGETSITIDTGSTGGGLGASTVLKSDGSSCSSASECTNGYCVHSICRSAATYCGDGYCDSGESSSSCSVDCPAAAVVTPSGGAVIPTKPKEEKPVEKPAEEKPPVIPPVQVVAVEIPITDSGAIQEIIIAIKATDLGVDTIKIENVEVKKIGIAEATTTTQAPILEKVVEEAVKTVTEESAKQVLQEIKQAVSTGSSAPVPISIKVEVFEVKEKTTGKTAVASKVTLILKPEKDLKEVNIVEVIPKSVAASISEVIFLGEQPKVLQADPVVQWQFAEVKKDETKDLSYQVAKKIEKVETKTVAVAEAVVPEVKPEAKPVKIFIYLVIGLIAVAVAYFIYRNKKFSFKSRQFKYHYRPK